MILNSSTGIDRRNANHCAVGQLFTESPATIDRWFDSGLATASANARYHNTFAGTSKPTARRQSPRRHRRPADQAMSLRPPTAAATANEGCKGSA
jgi:hypothetical protein